MNQTLNTWLERLTSLYKSQMRQAASQAGIQMVHLEVMQYLSVCNGYSNTAQALSEYLGQTKGSISQTLKVMEPLGLIEKRNCEKDKRMVRLFLTDQAQDLLNDVEKNLVSVSSDDQNLKNGIQNLLKQWQQANGQSGFGLCQTCRHHQQINDQQFHCQLTKEDLPVKDRKKLCREHAF